MRLTKTMLAAALASVVVVFSGVGELACRVCAGGSPQARKGADDKGEAKPWEAARYDLAAEATQPTGSPLLLKLITTNTGTETLRYWSPGYEYPPLWAEARVTDAVGKARNMPLSNGVPMGGLSGLMGGINPGRSLTSPAAMAPLPEGSYSIEVYGARAKVTVKEDADLLTKREDDLLARIGKGEPFAMHVAAAYLTPSLFHKLLRELSATDAKATRLACLTLEGVEKPPAEVVPLLARAVDEQLALGDARPKRSPPCLGVLTELAGRIGSDEALDAVIKLSGSGLEDARDIPALGMFKQERAVQELQKILKGADAGRRNWAGLTLADHRDPAAVEVLLAGAAEQSSWRGGACEALANYPDDPRVESAIKGVLDDREHGGQAKDALERLHRAQKK